MCFFRKTIKSALPAFLFFVLTFTGCSNLDHETTSSVTFTINTSRLALVNFRAGDADGESDSSKVFMDIELAGGYKDSKTVALEPKKEMTISFDGVPVGSEVYVASKIYTLFENEKVIFFQGKTESKKIEREGNDFKVTLEKAYDYVTETASAYIVSWPLFLNYSNKEKLTTNNLTFNRADNAEEFAWSFDKFSDYQKARITFKADALNTGDNNISFHFFKNSAMSWYFQKDLPVTAERVTYEFEIPQGINIDSIYITNRWVLRDRPEDGSWADDFICSIEKIELLKDASLIDPELNQITKTDTTYTVKNPVLQNTAYTAVYKNTVTFDSISGIKREKNAFSAAYWEFDDLADYDIVTIRYKCENPNEIGMRFSVKGYVPRNLPSTPECKHGADIGDNQSGLIEAGRSESFTYRVSNLLEGLDGHKVTAIEFQNESYLGLWEELNFGSPWTLEVEEIYLEKTGFAGITINVPQNQDIEVIVEETANGKKFTAPSGYSTYVWKVNGVVQTATGTIFNFDMSSIQSGIYDISLLANSESRNDSWTAQITKN